MNTSILKYLTILLMTCDHIGLLLCDGRSLEMWRLVGQVGFPMWGFLMVQGFTHTKNFKVYFEKVILLACLSQFVYWIIGLHGFNPVFGLAAGLLVMQLDKTLNEWVGESPFDTILVFIACLMFIGVLYVVGVHPIFPLMVYAFYLSRDEAEMMCFVGAVMIVYAFFGAWYGISVFIGLALISITGKVNLKMVLPRWVFYCYYPVHLTIIWGISAIM